MAKKYPNSQITAVSNSKDQKSTFWKDVPESQINNVKVITADMNDFETQDKYDNVISIEMFEHMRNYKDYYQKFLIYLMKMDHFLFIFLPMNFLLTLFEDEGDGDWMARRIL